MCVASLVRKSIVACPTWLTIYHYPWLFYSFSEKEKRGTERDDLSLYGRTFTGLECNFDFFGLPRRRTSAGIVRCLPIVTWFNAQTLRREEHTENKRKEYCRDLRRWTMFVLPFPTQSRPILSWSKGQGQEIDTQVFFFPFFIFGLFSNWFFIDLAATKKSFSLCLWSTRHNQLDSRQTKRACFSPGWMAHILIYLLWKL